MGQQSQYDAARLNEPCSPESFDLTYFSSEGSITDEPEIAMPEEEAKKESPSQK